VSDWFYKKLSIFSGYGAIAVLMALIVFLANLEIKDLDLWLHFATGKFIVTHHFVPFTDIFSCTILGQPWINHEWLFQVLVYWIFQNIGDDGLIGLRVFLIFSCFFLTILLGYHKDRQIIPIITLLLVFLVAQVRFILRPDLFSLLFLLIYIRTLSLYCENRWSMWFLFVIQVLWTNIHGFFIFGPLLVFLAFFSEWMKRHIRLPFQWNKVGRLNSKEYKHIKETFTLVIIACLFNPLTIKGAFYPLSVLVSLGGESKIFFEFIRELAKPITWSTLFDFTRYPYFKMIIETHLLPA